MSDTALGPTASTSVRASEDTVFVQICERTSGLGIGVVKLEGRFCREAVPYFQQLKQFKGPRNLNVAIDGVRLDIPFARGVSGGVEEAADRLPEDEESRLLSFRKEQLRSDIARQELQLKALSTDHDRQRQLLTADIERIGKQVTAEETRLKEARLRTDAALNSMNDEVDQKHKQLIALGELEATLAEGIKMRIEAVEGELIGTMNTKGDIDRQVKEKLEKMVSRNRMPLRHEVMDYVKASAPSEAVSALLSAAALKVCKKMGLNIEDFLKGDEKK